MSWMPSLQPLVIVLVGAILVVLVPLWAGRRGHVLAVVIALAAMGATLALAWGQWNAGGVEAAPMLIADRLTSWATIVLAIGATLSIGLSLHDTGSRLIPGPEMIALILFSTLGMMIVTASSDLFLTFLGIEILSLAVYILTGLARTTPVSNEAALKYFALGAFSSAFFLFGVACYYGVFGTTSLQSAAPAVAGSGLAILATALLIVGIAFKGAWAPFHLWTPDVYQGAPTNITAFMAGSVKVAAFILAIRVLTALQPVAGHNLPLLLAILAAATILVGNLGALFQNNIKRLLAYSAIAHAGYALIGLAVGNPAGVLVYLICYLLMTIGSFGVVVAMGKHGDEISDLDDFAGLSQRHPALAAVMALFMFALTGLPPTIGFAGKFYLFQAAVENGWTWLALVGILGSLISVAYYFRVVWIMYFGTTESEYEPPAIPYNVTAVLAVTGFSVLYLGIFPGSIIALARQTLGLP